MSQYLIRRGWRPSPTTARADGAWEHERLSIVPRGATDEAGTYGDGVARFSKEAAIVVQAVRDGHLERRAEHFRRLMQNPFGAYVDQHFGATGALPSRGHQPDPKIR